MVRGISSKSMAGREICCCGARSWTKVIAYVQIAIHGIACLIVAIILIAIAVGGRGLFKKVVRKMDSDEEDESDELTGNERLISLMGYIGYLIFLMILLAVFAIGVVTGIFLLKGVFKNKTRYLKIWTVFAGAFAILIVLSVLVSPSFDDILGVLFSVGLYAFAIWVVRILVAEMEMDEAKREERNRPPEGDPYYLA